MVIYIKIILLLSALLVLSLVIVGCSEKQSEKTDTSEISEEKITADRLTIEITGVAGANVLELTEKEHAVDYSESSMGVFVNAIDSIASGDGYYWLYTVNDEPVNVACDKYITEDNDIIKWHFKKP